MKGKVKKWINPFTIGVFMGGALFVLFILVLNIWNIFELNRRLPIVELIVFLLNPSIVFLIWERMRQRYLQKDKAIRFPFLKSFVVMILVYTICMAAFFYIERKSLGIELFVLLVLHYSISMLSFILAIRILQIIINALNHKNESKIYYIEFILPGVIFSIYKMLQIEEFYILRKENLPAEYYNTPLIRVYLYGTSKLAIVFLIYCLALFIWRKLMGYYRKADVSEIAYYRNGIIIFLFSLLSFSYVFVEFASVMVM